MARIPRNGPRTFVARRRPTRPRSISKRSRTIVRAAQLTSPHGSPVAFSSPAPRPGVRIADVERELVLPEIGGEDAQPSVASRCGDRRAETAACAGDEHRPHLDEQARADRATEIAELGEPVLRRVAEERVRARRPLDPAEPALAEPLAEPAAEDHGLDVEQRDGAEPMPTPSAPTASSSSSRATRPSPPAHGARHRSSAASRPALALEVEQRRLAPAGHLPCAVLERAAPAYASTQPRKPQLQRRPPGLTHT